MWRSSSMGYFLTILWYSLAGKSASSESCCEKIVILRTRPSTKRQASPNQAPAATSASSSPPPRRPSPPPPSSSFSSSPPSTVARERPRGGLPIASKRRSKGSSAFTNIRRRPTTTNTTSCSNCPASTTRSPALHCTQVWACAISAINAAGALQNRGKCNTVELRSSSVSSRCIEVESLLSKLGASVRWCSWCRRVRKLCSTRLCSSPATRRRRRKRAACTTWRSTSSSKRPFVTCVSNDTMQPLKNGARHIVKMARIRPVRPEGDTSPYPTVVTVIMTQYVSSTYKSNQGLASGGSTSMPSAARSERAAMRQRHARRCAGKTVTSKTLTGSTGSQRISLCSPSSRCIARARRASFTTSSSHTMPAGANKMGHAVIRSIKSQLLAYLIAMAVGSVTIVPFTDRAVRKLSSTSKIQRASAKCKHNPTAPICNLRVSPI
mmetsp:Transcript_65863/g.186150  ORF Transcript_65863/g.186150 Transcript_65863/m.186150 type:complete len:437 (-) Transcript_65863:48-1358(-)